MTEISVTLKGSGGYDAPWIVVRAETVDELDGVLAQLNQRGAFAATKTLAQEFIDARPVTGEAAVAAVQAAIPGSTVQSPTGPVSGGTQASPARPSAPVATVAVKQSLAPCEDCGAETVYRSGNHPVTGEWEALFCTVDSSHRKFLRR
jgi:hypothetical protein